MSNIIFQLNTKNQIANEKNNDQHIYNHYREIKCHYLYYIICKIPKSYSWKLSPFLLMRNFFLVRLSFGIKNTRDISIMFWNWKRNLFVLWRNQLNCYWIILIPLVCICSRRVTNSLYFQLSPELILLMISCSR